MGFQSTSRLWKKADLLTAIIELHAVIYKRQKLITPAGVAPVLGVSVRK